MSRAETIPSCACGIIIIIFFGGEGWVGALNKYDGTERRFSDLVER